MKSNEISDPNMRNVYTIKYDEFNKVIHAATGPNGPLSRAFGLTFDASSEATFGKLLQIWDAGSDVC